MPRLLYVSLCLVVTAAPGFAQEDEATEVRFNTADGVILRGTFFRGNKGGDSPVAMFIHRFGSDRTKGDWTTLAKLLSAKGIASFSFDLRGHGDSKEVIEMFWAHDHNKKGVRGYSMKNPPREISIKDFKPNYFPALVNDLVAARFQIDRMHADGKCNSNNLFVIGADEGASLGMFWISVEWPRNIVRREDATGALLPIRSASPDLAAGIWLSPRLRPQNSSFRITDWYKKNPKLIEELPQCIFHGAEDGMATSDSRAIFAVLDPKASRGRINDLNFIIPVRTKLQGQELLSSKFDVTQNILKFVEKVAEKRSTITRQAINLDHQPFYPVQLGAFGFRFN